MPDKKDIYYAQAYRYSHTYDSEHMTPTQQVIVKDVYKRQVLYYVDGSDPVHEKPVIKQTEKRYLVLDYENPGLKEKGITPQFYTWSSGCLLYTSRCV